MAVLRLELAQAYLGWLHEEREALGGTARFIEAAYAVWGCAPLGAPGTVARPVHPPVWVRWPAYYALAVAILWIGVLGSRSFIYFQF